MLETWRWFGPDDPVTCAHIRQAGADGIVTALHHKAPGVIWQPEDIAARKAAQAEKNEAARRAEINRKKKEKKKAKKLEVREHFRQAL